MVCPDDSRKPLDVELPIHLKFGAKIVSLSLFKKALIMSSVGIATLFALVFLIHRKDTPNSTPIEIKYSSHPLRVTGLKSSAYKEGKLLSRVQADAFKVRPRKLWIFNIRPFNEAILTNINIELYYSRDTFLKPGAFLDKLLTAEGKDRKSCLKRMGVITKCVIKGLRLKIFMGKEPAIIISSDEAYVDFKKKETRLIGAKLQDPISKDRIEAKSIIWDNIENGFRIPGKYIVVTSKGMERGKGIRMDMTSIMMSLKSGNSWLVPLVSM